MEKDVITKMEALVEQILELSNEGIILSNHERRCMPGMGAKRLDFVEKVVEIIEKEEGFLSRDFDIDILKQNILKFKHYKILLSKIEVLKVQVRTNMIQYGTLSYKQALAAKKSLDNSVEDKYVHYRNQLKDYFEERNK